MRLSTAYIFFRIGLTVISVAPAFALSAQPAENSIRQQFDSYQQYAFQEKIYLHTDRDFYIAGELCWFKAYTVDMMFNRPTPISKIAYVELMNNQGVAVAQAKIGLAQGMGDGTMLLPVTLASGNYTLRAYTRWMKNFGASAFFEKPVTIVNTRRISMPDSVKAAARYDVQFFPEGGNLLAGIAQKIGFRIADRNGKGMAAKGTITDEQGAVVANFETYKFGLGSVMLTPGKGHTYTASLVIGDSTRLQQTLPVAYESGYAMQLQKTGATLHVAVNATGTMAGNSLYLFIHTRGAVKKVERLTLQDGKAGFSIDTAQLGPGVSQFTLFNEARQPVCERLFFRRPTNCLALAATADKSDYGTRQKVQLLVTPGPVSDPVHASLSVYRLDSLDGPESADLSSYFWLSADLSGTVESPNYYLSHNDETAIENLLLTHGWRRFQWNDILRNSRPSFEFSPEYRGHIVTGRVFNNGTGQPEKNAEAYLSLPNTRTVFSGTYSDDTGTIKFEMTHFYGGNEIVVQPGSALNRVEINSPFSPMRPAGSLPSFQLNEKMEHALAVRHSNQQVQQAFFNTKMNQWEEKDSDTIPFYNKPDASYMLDDYTRFTTVEEIFREFVPDVTIGRNDGKYILPVFDLTRQEFFRGDPMILLDGVPIDADKLMKYDPLKIRKIDIVARMYIRGNMFFEGIINCSTYNGDMPGLELDPKATVLDYEGLQQKREFFSPVYQTKQEHLPDFRHLLYWNPDIHITDAKNGTASFYTPDIPGRYVVMIQGLSDGGATGSGASFFNVSAN